MFAFYMRLVEFLRYFNVGKYTIIPSILLGFTAFWRNVVVFLKRKAVA